MRLPDDIHEATRKAGVVVYFAPRAVTKLWNRDRESHELLTYGGWYWHRFNRAGRMIDHDRQGPFKSEQAAVRDAFIALQLRRNK